MPDSISKKIQKLFALAEGNANQNEAESAMKKAEALLVEHNLSMSDIESDDKKFESEFVYVSKFDIKINCILTILRNHFFVETLNFKQDFKIELFGEHENLQSAIYAFNFLSDTFHLLWCSERYAYKVEFGIYPKAKIHNSFVVGLYIGFNDKLEDQKKETLNDHFDGDQDKANNALIAINNLDHVTEYMESERDIVFKKSRTKYDPTSESFFRGMVKGGDIEISKAIGE
jgi:hypothetical protein